MGIIYKKSYAKIKIAVISFLSGFLFACVIMGGYLCISI